ncbi:hypothetical protein CF326_g2747 [Tilletia indica]|nr:hypothetical protein CF326_g2747 [Tilletia indica]
MPSDILAALLPELVIEIFSQLDPASLTRCTAVSKAWRKTIANDLIWRRVATKQLGLCPDDTEVQDLATLPSLKRWSASGHLAGLTSFRQLCVRWQQILVGWRGRRGAVADDYSDHRDLDDRSEKDFEELFEMRPLAMFLDNFRPGSNPRTLQIQDQLKTLLPHPSKVGVNKIQATSYFIQPNTSGGQLGFWRIKTDPETSTLIATARQGGLFVIDIHNSQIIWQLGAQEVPAFAELEAEHGILIIHGLVEGGEDLKKNVQVWVHRRLIPDEGNGELYQSRSIIRTSQVVRASRFKWPIFCGMGELGTAFFWDVTDPDQPHQLNSIDASARHIFVWKMNSVDFDDQHLFLVGQRLDQVTIYDRTTGQVKWSMGAYLRQANAASLIRPYKVKMADLRADHTASRAFGTATDFFERKLLPQAIEPSILKTIERPGEGAAGEDCFPWEAVLSDEGTGALLMLAKHMLVIVPNFASLSEADCRVPIMTVEHVLPPNLSPSSLPRSAMSVADGRVFFLIRDPIILDLAPHRQAPPTSASTPFLLPEDPTLPPPVRVFASHDPRRVLMADRSGCSSAEMDAANIFAEVPWVTRSGNEEMPFMSHEVLHWRIERAESLPSTATM